MLRRTKHFEVKYKEDEKIIEGLLVQLEMDLENSLYFLKIDTIDPITINVYPTKEDFQKTLGKENIPDWLVAKQNENVIHVVSPNCANNTHSYEDILKAINHEVIGVIVRKINAETPKWLIEGIIGYLTQQYEPKSEQLEEDIENDNVPTINELEDDFIGETRYLYSYLYVDFLIDKYGENSLLNLLKSNDELEVYGTTYSTISNLFILENEMRL